MSDTISRDRFECLFAIAASQMGHVTTRQARDCGMASNLIEYHVRRGRLKRVHRGVYRLRDYPSAPREEVMAAWLAAGPHRAVVSHESALDLFQLGDVIPDDIHLMVSRSVRNLPRLEGVRFHTTSIPLTDDDVVVRDGIRITSVARTILDLAQSGLAPDQIDLAVRQALDRGLVLEDQLETAASGRSHRVQQLIRDATGAAA